jgi:Ni/Fe-hydrogenase subunit HybB-like protein
VESHRSVAEFRERLEETVLAPLTRVELKYYAFVGVLLLVMAWGLYAYITQYRTGLVVTDMRDHSLWGLYISLFVFFIGISHAGTLISAILRVSKAGWRVPITRMAEFITVVALMIGAVMPIIDIGRPDRVHHLILFGRWQSPLIWDVIAITTYLTGSFIYLYLPLIPDFALASRRIGDRVSPIKRWFFKTLALGWRDTPRQRRNLTVALGTIMVLIIPVAVSVHTVVSWIFAMTLREPWNNPMFGPFFVAGAIYSGIASIIIVMAIIRKAYHLEEYITPQHFINLGYMLGGLAMIMMYFNAQEFVTVGYKLAGEAEEHFHTLFLGTLAPYFWTYAIGGMVAPALLILLPWTRNLPGILVASFLVDIGMFFERYVIVVGGATLPTMPYEAAQYFPTWVEWSIMAAAFATFALIITIAAKLLPVIAIWEVAEHHEQEAARGAPIGAAQGRTAPGEVGPAQGLAGVE